MGRCLLLLFHINDRTGFANVLVLTIANLDLDMGVALGDVLDASYHLRHTSAAWLLYRSLPLTNAELLS